MWRLVLCWVKVRQVGFWFPEAGKVKGGMEGVLESASNSRAAGFQTLARECRESLCLRESGREVLIRDNRSDLSIEFRFFYEPQAGFMTLTLEFGPFEGPGLIGKIGMLSSRGSFDKAVHPARDVAGASVVIQEVLTLVSRDTGIGILLPRVREKEKGRGKGGSSKSSNDIVHLVRGVFITTVDLSKGVYNDQDRLDTSNLLPEPLPTIGHRVSMSAHDVKRKGISGSDGFTIGHIDVGEVNATKRELVGTHPPERAGGVDLKVEN